MRLDFSNSIWLTEKEINKFNIFFSQKEVLEEMKVFTDEIKRRKKILNKSVFTYFIIILILFIITWGNLSGEGYFYLLIIIIFPILISYEKNFFKNNHLLNNFLKYMFWDNIKFDSDNKNFSESYKDLAIKTWFFNGSERYYSSEDSLSYSYKIDNVNSINLEWIEIKVDNSNSNNRNRKSYYVFKLTFLNPRYALDTPINIKKWSDFILGNNRVKLENQVFEKLFNVYSKDELTARQILNPLIMQNIADYINDVNENSLKIDLFFPNKIINRNFEMFLFKNEFYIKFDSYSWFLDFSGFKVKKDDYILFYSEIKNIINFANKINLIYFDKNYFTKQ